MFEAALLAGKFFNEGNQIYNFIHLISDPDPTLDPPRQPVLDLGSTTPLFCKIP